MGRASLSGNLPITLVRISPQRGLDKTALALVRTATSHSIQKGSRLESNLIRIFVRFTARILAENLDDLRARDLGAWLRAFFGVIDGALATSNRTPLRMKLRAIAGSFHAMSPNLAQSCGCRDRHCP